MITLPDGASSVTNMYFWQPFAGSFYAPCVDGDYDMGVIGHEYGHMIENRMLGKGSNRVGHHAGAMGESFGDMNGMEYLNENGFVPTSDENPFAIGTYDTGNKQRAIRNYGMNYPTSGDDPTAGRQLFINALNFSDMGYDLTGPTPTSGNQVHANGEIWSKVNFGIRQLLADKYDDDFPVDDADLQASCAEGELPPQSCPGNRRWFQLYYDAMLLAPAASSMLEMRNAMLAADLTRFGGANQEEIWLGFARGGMGDGATSIEQLARGPLQRRVRYRSDAVVPARLSTTTRRSGSASGTRTAARSATPGSSSGTTRLGSRRSATPTRRRLARTSTTWPTSLRARTSSWRRLPATDSSVASGPSAGARTRRSSSGCRRTTRPSPTARRQPATRRGVPGPGGGAAG